MTMGEIKTTNKFKNWGKKSHNITQNTPIIFITQSEERKDLPNLFSQRVYEKKLIFPSRRVKIPEGT